MSLTIIVERESTQQFDVELWDFFNQFTCKEILDAMIEARRLGLFTKDQPLYDREDIKEWAMSEFNLVNAF